MAGDWIKVESSTADKPEIHAMARHLNVLPETILGALIRVWVWADQQSIDGNALAVTENVLDRISCVTGLAQAMRSVGWLEGADGALSLPRFDRHNGKSAKNRAVSNARVKRFRNDSDVTKALPEKRREELTAATTGLKDSPPTASKKKERGGYRISFDKSAGKFVGITNADELRWQEAYPDVQIPVDIERAAAHLFAKRGRGVPKDCERFLLAWFGRTQDRITNTQAAAAQRQMAMAR